MTTSGAFTPEQAQRVVGTFVRMEERQRRVGDEQASVYAERGEQKLADAMAHLADMHRNIDYRRALSELTEQEQTMWIEMVASGADRLP